MRKTIKFSKEYPKLWNQEFAQLLNIEIMPSSEFHKDLIEYDTKANDGTYYPLPKNQTMIHLTFLGNKGIPFCTIRRYTTMKWKYYKESIKSHFKIEVNK